ncbi:endonuclease MutS2 [Salinibacter ruber]|uniref:endonuclease MutS2 n=1 Tax=Salinibacter ruber TaxID=146919 RepID=UPI002167DD16|nr:endonuclease MutS2 [Salinibacter ruber]MCS4223347.1 DNA mismatch repair protein MutS2 [Salinibacter ruber]
METYPDSLDEKLGFDVVRDRLAARVQSPLGEERLASMRPARTMDWLRGELGRVEELQGAFQYGDSVPLSPMYDLRDALRRAAPEDAYVDPEDLMATRRTLVTLRRLKKHFEARREDYPRLADAVARATPLPDLEETIASILDEDASIRDDASPELRRLRQQIRSKEEELRTTLDKALRHAVREGHATGEQATLRGGRMVIPVRASAKGKVEGFVHDRSASGQTVYIEPAACLELNNEVRELQSAEQAEIERILRRVTDHVRAESDAIEENLTVLAQFDLLRAKARFANRLGAVVPKLNDEGHVEIYEGRNPVLQLHFEGRDAGDATDGRASGEEEALPPREVVPLDLELGADFRTLVITGPNAGGKTVTMKTVGLFSLMLAYGLPLPVAPHSSFPLFDQIVADIGDEQSIEDDLSTFSSHVSNLRHMLSAVGKNALVLIDEAGTGTDPDEGAALAQAVLERLTEAGARTIATTHHGTLKTYAHEAEAVENGSMEFDQETLRPTHRYQEGVPGSSYAFEIARRMGLSGDLLDRARTLAGTQKTAMENLITTFERRTQELEDELYDARKAREKAEAEQQRYEEKTEKLEKERDAFRQQALEEAERIVEEANARIENTIREIKEAQAESDATQEAREQLEDYKADLQARREEAAPEQDAAPAEADGASPAAAGGPINEGDQVVVDDGSTAVEVQEIEDGEARLLMGSMHMRVSLDRLTRVGGPESAEPDEEDTGGNAEMAALEASPSIDVRGERVDEARRQVQHFLDDAVAANLDTVEILHGKGTGALRNALHEMLSGRPDVADHRKAPIEEGGAGVTKVDL